MSGLGFLGLVRRHIRSVWSLELLLLLRSRSGEASCAEALVQELRASTSLIAGCLSSLQEAGLASHDGGAWRFAPATLELTQFCDQLAEAYQTRPVALINMIAAPSQVQDLADAFRFSGGEDR